MNNNEKLNYEILQKLIAFKNENEEDLKLVPLLWLMLEDALAIYTKLCVLIQEDEKNGKVLTQEKENTFEDLIDEAANVDGMLTSYGNYKNFIPFKNVKDCKKTELKRARDEDVITNIQTMVSVMKDSPEERAEAGITDERLAAFEVKITAATNILYGPEEFRLKQRDLNVKIENELDGFKSLLNDSIKPNVRSNFADSNPDLYQAFLIAIHTDALPTKTKVIVGNFTNVKGEPVCDVWVKLDDGKAMKKGGKKGQFYFYNVSPGQHSLEFSKESYKDEKRVFMLEADHSMSLDIVFILEDIVIESETDA